MIGAIDTLTEQSVLIIASLALLVVVRWCFRNQFG